ncbi:MAG: RluA family pseudouridine synthase [Spirochaetota bacterium]|nr:RluA family pseudouridine synthase [Spirochaetota bacterium]
MPNEIIELTVPEECYLERIDRFLSQSLEIDTSRNHIQRLIRDNNITANGKEIKQNYKVKTNDIIRIELPTPQKLKLERENTPLDIIYEDNSIAVINKPSGIVVHPGPGHWNKTLVNALLYHFNDLSSIGGILRPGIVHRLDKDTCGLMIIAKNDQSHRFIVEEFSHRRVIKRYSAIVVEKPKSDHEIIDKPIGRHPKYRHKMTIMPDGKDSVTEYYLKRIWNTGNGIYSFMDIFPHTGRTHQIRVHLSSNGTPVVGDPIYSKKWQSHKVPFLLLASTYLEFTNPENNERLSFETPLPEHIENFIKKLDKLSL